MTNKPKIILGMGTCGMAAGAKALLEKVESHIRGEKD